MFAKKKTLQEDFDTDKQVSYEVALSWRFWDAFLEMLDPDEVASMKDEHQSDWFEVAQMIGQQCIAEIIYNNYADPDS